MLDTMTFTKILGAFCGALLVFLLGKWAAEEVYHVGGDGHGKGEHKQAYVIDTGEEDVAAEEEETVDFAAIFASADAAKGEKVWGKCRSCHKLEEGANGSGPYLYGIVDRQIAAVGDFRYSGALPADQVWSVENLNGFLESPKGWAPGTSMGFKGLPKPEDRANLIAYLQTFGG